MNSSDDLTKESVYLPVLLQKVENLLQWGPGEHWRHQDFQLLSEKIWEKTGEQLSNTTLKRIWGKLEYRSLPTSHTLNTLAQFAGFESWVVFTAGLSEDEPGRSDSPIRQPAKSAIAFQLKSGFKKYGFAALLLCLIAGVFSLIATDDPKGLLPAQLESIQFSSYPVSTGVPNTVVFKYDVSKVPGDHFQIQQSWDSTLRVAIRKDQSEVATTYYYPGYWRAKLLMDGQILKEHDVYIKTQGWMATIDRDPIPRYLRGDELVSNGYLAAANSVQQEITSRVDAPEWMTYAYVDEFVDLHSDNFSLEMSFKNTYTKGDGICQFSRIIISCSDGIFIIPFSIPGCVGDLSMQFSELSQNGSQQDLSAFGCDFTNWQHFRLEVKNRHAQLFLNGRKIHEATYTTSAGKIAGLKARFLGAGAIDQVILKNQDGKVVFQDDFAGNLATE